jgi:hypothetical protein
MIQDVSSLMSLSAVVVTVCSGGHWPSTQWRLYERGHDMRDAQYCHKHRFTWRTVNGKCYYPYVSSKSIVVK